MEDYLEISLKVGKRFDTLEELEEAQQQYQYANYCELWKRDVRTLESAKKRAPKRVNMAKTALRYYSVKLSCKFGGKAPVQRTDKKRSSCSFRQGCPFEVYLRLSPDGNALEVLNVNDIHNHALTRDAFRPQPQPHITEAERYSRALRTALSLASSACTGGMKLFSIRLSQMNGLLRQWRSNDGHCGQASKEANEALDHFLTRLGDKEIKDALQISSKGIKLKVQRSKNTREGECGYITEESLIKTKANEKGTEKQPDSRVVTRISKRGRPRGKDPPALNPPQSTKKAKQDNDENQPKPFRKLRVREKHRVVLECFVSGPTAMKALQGTPISVKEVQTDVSHIPDLVRDEDNVDLQQVERYFSSEAWGVVLNLRELDDTTPRTSLRQQLKVLPTQETPVVLKEGHRERQPRGRMLPPLRKLPPSGLKLSRRSLDQSLNISNIKGTNQTYADLSISDSGDSFTKRALTWKQRPGFRKKRTRALESVSQPELPVGALMKKTSSMDQSLRSLRSNTSLASQTYADLSLLASDESSLSESINLEKVTRFRKRSKPLASASQPELSSKIVAKKPTTGKKAGGKMESSVFLSTDKTYGAISDSLLESSNDSINLEAARKMRYRSRREKVVLSQPNPDLPPLVTPKKGKGSSRQNMSPKWKSPERFTSRRGKEEKRPDSPVAIPSTKPTSHLDNTYDLDSADESLENVKAATRRRFGQTESTTLQEDEHMEKESSHILISLDSSSENSFDDQDSQASQAIRAIPESQDNDGILIPETQESNTKGGRGRGDIHPRNTRGGRGRGDIHPRNTRRGRGRGDIHPETQKEAEGGDIHPRNTRGGRGRGDIHPETQEEAEGGETSIPETQEEAEGGETSIPETQESNASAGAHSTTKELIEKEDEYPDQLSPPLNFR
ncbi:hypothetical protein C7M84_021620 [Penaeus vannamei]|uniref:ZSWIM3 N-terminal domain-containing protein n=1 Tax=Penaeus vannamei TaxID=6689 RepID=A0A3R7SGX4_PENVA|nr:hypothetical protein C7M84_021620 [Penaeus vannamei]